MVGRYNFKLQWLFPRSAIIDGRIKCFLEAIGASNIDKVILRDIDLRTVREYYDYRMLGSEDANEDLLSYLSKQRSEKDDFFLVEFIKK